MYMDIFNKLSKICHVYLYGITVMKVFTADLPSEAAQKEGNILRARLPTIIFSRRTLLHGVRSYCYNSNSINNSYN
jgi:hypothetical protein